ncbi:hypothetical protein COO60DRAFT_1657637 [Scenedesmus sp. NREL 46B-D3]|nr:hypothetical protein COO60DRAFT_1657637 [Scenedesmus sp. NREL 46B-D3]
MERHAQAHTQLCVRQQRAIWLPSIRLECPPRQGAAVIRPEAADGTAGLSLAGTCICGYCSAPESSACEAEAAVSASCAAMIANATAAASGADDAAPDAGDIVAPEPSPGSNITDTAGDTRTTAPVQLMMQQTVLLRCRQVQQQPTTAAPATQSHPSRLLLEQCQRQLLLEQCQRQQLVSLPPAPSQLRRQRGQLLAHQPQAVHQAQSACPLHRQQVLLVWPATLPSCLSRQLRLFLPPCQALVAWAAAPRCKLESTIQRCWQKTGARASGWTPAAAAAAVVLQQQQVQVLTAECTAAAAAVTRDGRSGLWSW